MPTAQTEDTQGTEGIVKQGPDKKYYKFPAGTDPKRIDKFFKLNPRFNKPTVRVSEKARTGVKADSGTEPDPSAMRSSMTGGISAGAKNIVDYGLKQLPNVGGIVGDILGPKAIAAGPSGAVAAGAGAVGAGVVGEVGSLAKTAGEKLLYGSQYGPHGLDIIKEANTESQKQMALALGGRFIGEALTASKYIPERYRLSIVNGIRRMPWDISPSKAMIYMGNLLENLFPSTGTIAKARIPQTMEVEKAGMKIASSMSRFRGTSEEMGNLVQRSLEQAKQVAFRAMGKKPTPAELKTFEETFGKGLIKDLIDVSKRTKSASPNTVAGIIKGTEDIEGLRKMVDVLSKGDRAPALNAAKTQIIREELAKAISTVRDPMLKNKEFDRFSGPAFKKAIDKIGDEKLRILYGEKGYKNLKDFTDFVQHINGGMSGGIGRWLNFGLAAGLFYNPTKTAAVSMGTNVLARMFTSEAGTQFLKNYEIALAKRAPQALNAASTALRTYMSHVAVEERQDQDKLKEQERKAEEEYLKETKSNGGK